VNDDETVRLNGKEVYIKDFRYECELDDSPIRLVRRK